MLRLWWITKSICKAQALWCSTSRMNLNICPGDLTHPKVRALLHEHLSSMDAHSPPESIHALQLDELAAPHISFWCAWQGEALAGCGALKQLSPQAGEIKTMRTARQYLRQGVAAQMLEHIVAQATQRGYQSLSLETGTAQVFVPAQRLYRRFGFEYCEPFANYTAAPYSVFMRKTLG